MLNFDFQNKTEIIFGRDTEERVGKEIKKYGKKILLHYGGGSIKNTGLYDKVVESLKKENIEFVELAGVMPNPRVSLVREGIELCRKEGVDFVLAVGGGSVIDSAKAICAGVSYSGDVWDFCIKGIEVVNPLPLGTILTIPAAGSESSSGTVITNEDGWYKKSFGSNLLRPKFSVLNPVLTYTLPDYQTSAGVVDMMVHVFERYFTNEKNVELTDRLCEGVLKTIINNGRKVMDNPYSYDIRAEILWASTLAHNGLLDTGRKSDWASHGIEHELSGIYDITHGAGLAIVSPAWMKYVYKHDLGRFVQFANRVWDVEIIGDMEDVALEGIRRMERFFSEIGMPITLSEAGIVEDRFEEMAEKAVGSKKMGSFVKLDKNDIINIYKLAK